MAARGQDGMPVRGYQVSRADVRHLLDRLRKMPLKDRASVPGLSPDRADIIVAGLAIVDRVMDRFEVNSVQIHNRGVRDGLVLSMVEQSLGTGNDKPRDRNAALERLAASCGCEMDHSRHVAKLAGQIFAQLAPHCHLHAGRPAAAGGGRQAAGRRLPDQLRSAPQAQLPPDPAQPPGRFPAERTGNHRQRRPLSSRRCPQAQARQLPPAFDARSKPRAADGGHSARGRRAGSQQHPAGDRRHRRVRPPAQHHAQAHLASSFPKSTSGAPASGVSSSRRCSTPGSRSNGTNRAAAKRRPTNQAATAARRSRPPRHHEKSARARAGAHVGPGPKESSGATALSPHRGRSRFSSTKKRVASARRLVEPRAAG